MSLFRIKTILEKYQSRPRGSFRRSLWRVLARRFDEKYQPVYAWYQTFVFKMSVAIISGIVVVAGFSTGVYAYSSPEVTTGTLLYPLKQTIENAEEMTKQTPEAKAKFLLKKIQRREAEKAVMVRRQQQVDQVEKKIEEVEDKLDLTNQELEKVEVKDPELKPRVRARLEQRLEKQKHNLLNNEERLKNKENNLG